MGHIFKIFKNWCKNRPNFNVRNCYAPVYTWSRFDLLRELSDVIKGMVIVSNTIFLWHESKGINKKKKKKKKKNPKLQSMPVLQTLD